MSGFFNGIIVLMLSIYYMRRIAHRHNRCKNRALVSSPIPFEFVP